MQNKQNIKDKQNSEQWLPAPSIIHSACGVSQALQGEAAAPCPGCQEKQVQSWLHIPIPLHWADDDGEEYVSRSPEQSTWGSSLRAGLAARQGSAWYL